MKIFWNWKDYWQHKKSSHRERFSKQSKKIRETFIYSLLFDSNPMGLDADLCQKAKELYEWEIEFKGEPLELLRREDIFESRWISGKQFPKLAVGVLPLTDYTRYGFIDLSDPHQLLYQPCVKVHSSRAANYHSDLLGEALISLRIDVGGPSSIRLPVSLQRYVTEEHLHILAEPHEKLRGRGNGEVPIYDISNERVRKLVIGQQLSLFEQD